MEQYEYQLKKQQAIGMSYGSKSLAQVVKDMYKPYLNENDDISLLSEEEKSELLNMIYEFLNKTLEISVDSLIETINELKNTMSKISNTNNTNNHSVNSEVKNTKE